MKYFSFTDVRFGDTFTIWYDESDLSLIGIERHVGNVGSNPITYSTLWEVPQPFRSDINSRLSKLKCPPSSRQS